MTNTKWCVMYDELSKEFFCKALEPLGSKVDAFHVAALEAGAQNNGAHSPRLARRLTHHASCQLL